MKSAIALITLFCLVPASFGQSTTIKPKKGKAPAANVAVRPKQISGDIASISSQDPNSWKIEYKGVTYVVDVSGAKCYTAEGKLTTAATFKEGTQVNVVSTYLKKAPSSLTAIEVRELKLLVKAPVVSPKRKAPRKRGG